MESVLYNQYNALKQLNRSSTGQLHSNSNSERTVQTVQNMFLPFDQNQYNLDQTFQTAVVQDEKAIKHVRENEKELASFHGSA